jgi:uncharacterized protein
MVRWGTYAGIYAVFGVVALALIWPRGSPLLHPDPRLVLDVGSAHLWSLCVGLAFGSFLVVTSRITVQRFAWAQRLHLELRPFARELSTRGILVLAVLSSVCEELLFRGLLQPWIGLLPQAVLFGLLHYMPGPSRWIWAGWAFLVGLSLGALFDLTGSLIGPVIAHALVNGVNLRFLKRHDPASQPYERSVGVRV